MNEEREQASVEPTAAEREHWTGRWSRPAARSGQARSWARRSAGALDRPVEVSSATVRRPV